MKKSAIGAWRLLQPIRQAKEGICKIGRRGMKPRFDKRTFLKIKGIKSPERMFEFLQEIYRLGFEDGANADVDPSVHYMALKRGVVYECGNCGAVLHLDDGEEEV